MSTVRDLIQGAMRLIGALATGEQPSAAEQTDALNVLNDMVDSWSNEGLSVYQRVREVFPLTPGQQAYTIGVGGVFNTARPQQIEIASILTNDTQPIEIPIQILTQDDWSAISVKSTQSTYPTKIYDDNAFPLDTLYLWPIPSSASNLVLYSWKPIANFVNPSDTIVLPPGYKKALRYGLALELAPEYGKQIDPLIPPQYDLAKENIKRMNFRTRQLDVDPALVVTAGGFNYLTGD